MCPNLHDDFLAFYEGKGAYRRRFVARITASTGIAYDDGMGGFITATGQPGFGISDVPGYNERTCGMATFDTSIIASGATINYGYIFWRTTTGIESGTVLTREVDLAIASGASLSYNPGTVVSSNITQASNTNYNYTLTSGNYTLIGTGAGATTSIVWQNSSTIFGSGSDSIYFNINVTTTNRPYLEVGWTQ